MPFDFILSLLKILSLACDIRFTFSEILILFTLERPVSLFLHRCIIATQRNASLYSVQWQLLSSIFIIALIKDLLGR